MPLADYLTGVAFFAGTWGAVLLGALLLVRRRLAYLTGAPRLVAFGLLATGGIVAVHLVPGSLGVLSRWSVLVSALVLALGALRVRAVSGPSDPPRRPAFGDGPIVTAAAVLAAGAVTVAVLAWAWIASVTPTIRIDALGFHLPGVARWIQSGSFWQVDQFTPLLANGNYPNSGDVVFLSVVLPWENDAFVQLLNVPFLAAVALAVYALARELGAPWALSTLVAALFVSLPVVLFTTQAGAQTDLIMLATFGGGILFLIRHFRSGRPAELVLAGLGLGLAFGTKWYGVPAVAVVVAVWAAASALSGRRAGEILRHGGALAGLVALAGGFWLVRNWVESGNPVFPVKVELAGLTVFDAPRDPIRECAGFTVAHYFGAWDVWSEHILPAYRDNFGLTGAAILAGALAAFALALRRRGGEGGGTGLGLALAGCAALLTAAYAVTPYSALGPEDEPVLVGGNTRYALPALLVAAALLAWGAVRVRWLRPALALLSLVAVGDGLRQAFDVPAGLHVKVVVALAVAAALVYVARALVSRAAQGVAIGLVVVAAVALGHDRQRDFNDGRYQGFEPALDWIARHAPEHRKIGLAGAWDVHGLSPVFPPFGPRLENEVAYVGEFRRGLLSEYETRAEWAAAIRRGRFELLVVGTGGYSADCPVPGSDSDEHVWARREGFPVVARSDRLTLYRVPTAYRSARRWRRLPYASAPKRTASASTSTAAALGP